MAKCCPRACGRLTTAAIFICVGVIQLIAGIILMKADYAVTDIPQYSSPQRTFKDPKVTDLAYMLGGPNVWTALSNIAVGILLGVASTVWKTINKTSSKHANRRKFLAALVGSVFILNATTAAMLIISEGNSLLTIYTDKDAIDSPKTLAKEILAYAYATSVCSPIVCVVVSVAFLTGICFRQKSKAIKTLDFKNILDKDGAQIYDWVYTSNLPKPDPEVLMTAFSSESESSSSESESDSSSDLPVPLHLRSRSSLNNIKNSQHISLENRSLPFSAERFQSSTDSVSSNFGKIRSIPRLKNSSLIKTPVKCYNESFYSCRSAGASLRLTPNKLAYRSDSKPGTPVRIGTLEKPSCPPNFQHNSTLTPNPEAKLSFSLINQETPYRQQLALKAKCLAMDESLKSRQSSIEDSVQEVSELYKTANYSPNPHSKICRTSTTNQMKVQQELENLDNSAIQFDAGVTALKEIYLDESMPEVKDRERLSVSNLSAVSSVDEKNCSMRSEGDMSEGVRNSNFRKKLSSKLVPAAVPVVSDNHSFYKTSNRKSTRSGRVKPYSKSKNGYDKYLQTGFSSFREQVDEVDAPTKMNNPRISRSLMTSISEKPSEEESDSFLPSTSTSGYMSASYEDESDDEADLKLNLSPAVLSSKQHPSPAQKLIADEIRERHRKRTERVSFELGSDGFQQENQNLKQLKEGNQTAISYT